MVSSTTAIHSMNMKKSQRTLTFSFILSGPAFRESKSDNTLPMAFIPKANTIADNISFALSSFEVRVVLAKIERRVPKMIA